MKISELIVLQEQGRYTAYQDPNVKGPDGQPLIVDRQGRVGYMKQSGRSRVFTPYDPNKTINAAQSQITEPDPSAIDYGAAMSGMQGTAMTDPGSPEAAAALQRILMSFLPVVGTGLDVKDAIDSAKKGEYGDAAASSVFALLGMVPLAGAPTRNALGAIKNFIQTNPKFLQRVQGKKIETPPAPAAKAPDTPPAPAAKAPDTPPAPAAPPAKATDDSKALLGPDGKPIKPQAAPEKPTGLVGADGKPLAATADKPDELARVASLAGVSSAAATGAKVAGKTDELGDIGKAAAKTDDVADGAKVSKAVEPGAVAKQADEVPVAPAAASVGRTTAKADDAASTSKLSTGQKVAGAAALGAVAGATVPGAISSTDKTSTAPDATKPTQPASAATDKPATVQPVSKPETTPKTNVDQLTFAQAFAAARKAAAAQGSPSTGRFTWRGKQYQTNVQGEPYVPANQQTPVEISERQSLDRIIQIANFKR